MKSQKGNTVLIVLLLAAVIIVGGYFLYQRGQLPSLNQTQQTGGIQNDTQLMSAASDLDGTNMDSIDTLLLQNDTDASSL